MLTTGDIDAHLKRVTYKPGWSFHVSEDPWEGQRIRILVRVPDAATGQGTTLGISSFLPPMDSTRAFDKWLAWRIGRIENHEMREFLKLDGRVLFDPHAV